jgi:hypothetical protein
MVATMKTADTDLARTILGTAITPSSTVTPDEWAEVLSGAAEMLPIESLSGLLSAKQILAGDSPRVRRTIGSDKLQYLFATAPLLELKRNAVYLVCATSDELPYQGFKDAPRKRVPSHEVPGLIVDELCAIYARQLLLTKEGNWVVLESCWIPQTSYSDEDTFPNDFWYKLSWAVFEHLPDKFALTKYIAYHDNNGRPSGDLGMKVLHHFLGALRETARRRAFAYNMAICQQEEMQRILWRLQSPLA